MRFKRLFEAAVVVVTLLLLALSAQALAMYQVPQIPHPTEGREDCLSCHAAGGVKPVPGDHEGRTNDTCLGCHSPAAAPEPTPTVALPAALQVVPTPIVEPELFAENTCISCHQGLGGKHTQITADWEASVHAERGVGCVSCHGGDPTKADAKEAMSAAAGYLGPLPKEQIPGLCGSCHTRVDMMRPYDLPTDQYDQYWQSGHGQALLQGDSKVATCFDCHDGHRVLKASDPTSQVYTTNEPAMCAGCHSDKARMADYGIPTTQYERYQQSVHGRAKLQNRDVRAPTCSTCHGKHGAAPPGFQQVADVCGQCHARTEEYYLQGVHRTGMTSSNAPQCITCHGWHDVTPATLDLFLGKEEGHCGSCHGLEGPTAYTVSLIYKALKNAGDAAAQAQATIDEGTQKHLIMAPQEELLQKANTPLIEARALQHTAILADVQAKVDESLKLSAEAQIASDNALRDIDTRRLAMVVALIVILITIVALVLIKRQLDSDLEAQRARRRSQAQ